MENLLENPLLLLPLLTGPILALAGWIMQKYPPKGINSLYGYRTPSAMKSEERWHFAQRYSAKELIKWGLGYTATALLGWFFDLSFELNFALAMALFIIMVFMPILRTERQLKARFGSVKE